MTKLEKLKVIEAYLTWLGCFEKAQAQAHKGLMNSWTDEQVSESYSRIVLENPKWLIEHLEKVPKFSGVSVPKIHGSTPLDVFEWMIQLKKRDMLWHQDDSVQDVFRAESHLFIMALAKQHVEAWNICTRTNVDIHLLSLCALGQPETIEETAQVLGITQTQVMNLLSSAEA